MIYEIKSYALLIDELQIDFLSKIDKVIIENLKKDSKLVFNMIIEGDVSELEIGMIEKLLDKYEIPHSNFYLIHNIFKIPKCKFNEFYYNFHYVNKALHSKELFNKNVLNKHSTNKTHKFHIPIRRFAKHRIELLEKLFLYDENFIKSNLVSYNVNFKNNKYLIKNRNKKFIEYIRNTKTQIIDTKINDHLSGYNKEDKQTYETSCITIVTETMFADGYNYLSEKIWKPIAHQHPFILMAPAYSLQYIKSLGFKTFEPFIDESYDNIEDNNIRFEKILNEIIKLDKLNIDEFITLVNNMKDIFEYNQTHLLNLNKEDIENKKNNFIYGNNIEPILEIKKLI